MDGAMDERYIQEVARLIAGTDSPRSCGRCGGLGVVTAAVPVDVQTLGVPCLPITYCRRCDAADPQAAELFAYLDEALGTEDAG
jgi:hypothetical protein